MILKEYEKMWKRKICIQFYKKLTTTINRFWGDKLLQGRKCSFEMLTCSKVNFYEGKMHILQTVAGYPHQPELLLDVTK